MNKADVLKELEAILEIDSGSLSENAALADYEQWNSLSILAFIAMADEKLHTVVSAKEIGKALKVKDLIGLVSEKLTE